MIYTFSVHKAIWQCSKLYLHIVYDSLYSDIDDSLLCMGRVLDRPSCRKVASIINNEIQPEMREVKLFYQNTCSTGIPI